MVTAADPRLILVVDDSRELLLAYDGVLAAAGFHVLTAPDGRKALSMVAEHHPAIVLLDMMMPETDGLEFLERLPEACPPPLPAVIANLEIVVVGYPSRTRVRAAVVREAYASAGVERFAVGSLAPGRLAFVVGGRDRETVQRRSENAVNAMRRATDSIDGAGSVALESAGAIGIDASTLLRMAEESLARGQAAGGNAFERMYLERQPASVPPAVTPAAVDAAPPPAPP